MPSFISSNGSEIKFTAVTDSGFNDYSLQLDESLSNNKQRWGKVCNIIGIIKTPQYFDGNIVVAEAVTIEVEDTSKSKIDEASQAFTVEGISDGIDADSFSVSGTAIFGSQSVVLSSIIKALSPIDLDNRWSLPLFPEFIEINGSSGFYDTSSSQFLTEPVTPSGTQTQISSFKQHRNKDI